MSNATVAPNFDSPMSIYRDCYSNETSAQTQCSFSIFLGALYFYGLPPAFLVGFLGNSWTIIVLCRMKQSRQNVYLVALAIADNFNLLFNGVFFHFSAKGIPYISSGKKGFLYINYGNIGCLAFRVIFHTGFTMPTYLFVVASADRLLAITRPMEWHGKGVKSAVLAAIGAVLTSFALNIPYTAVMQRALQSTGYMACTFRVDKVTSTIMQTYRILVLTYGLLPVMAIFVMTMVLIGVLQRASKTRAALSSSAAATATKERAQCIVLIIIALIFVACSLPNASILILSHILTVFGGASRGAIRLMYNARDVGDFVYYVQECSNVIIYWAKMTAFRRESKCLLSCCFTLETDVDTSNQISKSAEDNEDMKS